MANTGSDSTQKNKSTKKRTKNEFIPIYFSDLVKGVRKFWWLVIVLAVVLFSINFITSFRKYVPQYSASATFTISTSAGETRYDGGMTAYSFYFDAATALQLSTTFPYILNSNILQDAICEELGLDYLPVTLSASSVSGSNMFTIYSSGTDPQLVYDVLQSAIKRYPEAARYVVGNIRFTMITNPFVPTSPSNANAFVKDGTNGAMIGAFMGLAWILIYCVSRKTVRTREEVSELVGVDLLGVLPHVTFKRYKRKEIDRSILRTNPSIGRGFLESLRLLRNTFVHELSPNEKTILVTSTAPGEGKSTVTVNLALSLADLGKKVLLIDGDVRNPSVCEILDVDPDTINYDLTTDHYALGYLEPFRITVLNILERESYWKRMRAENVQALLDQFRDRYDYILLDTPPCGLISDTSVIAQATDAAVYVVLQDTVRVSRIRTGLDNLLTANVHVIGCVLNGAQSGVTGYGDNYGYGHYYGYGRYGYGNYGYGHYGHYGHYGYGSYGYGEGEDKRSKRSRRSERKSAAHTSETQS